MEMPDTMYMTDNETLWEAACRDVDKFNKYYHSRIVEALKAKNEELQAWKKGAEHAKTELDLERIRLQDIIRDLEAKRDGLLDIIDKQHTASLSLCDKLDKAKDALTWYSLETYYSQCTDLGQRARTTLEEIK